MGALALVGGVAWNTGGHAIRSNPRSPTNERNRDDQRNQHSLHTHASRLSGVALVPAGLCQYGEQVRAADLLRVDFDADSIHRDGLYLVEGMTDDGVAWMGCRRFSRGLDGALSVDDSGRGGATLPARRAAGFGWPDMWSRFIGRCDRRKQQSPFLGLFCALPLPVLVLAGFMGVAMMNRLVTRMNAELWRRL